MRIQKYLSQQNICSRRKAESFIEKGWVTVNGNVCTNLAEQIDPEEDTIELLEEAKATLKNHIYIAFNKPLGIVANCPQGDEKEIIDLLPQELKHLNCIGRLDKDSEGLILLTDDGVFSKIMLQPDDPHEREYEIRINSTLTKEMKTKLENGISLFQNKTQPTQIKQFTAKHFIMTMKEGRNRQIRRMIQKVGSAVISLKRVRFGSILLDDLNPGNFRHIIAHILKL